MQLNLTLFIHTIAGIGLTWKKIEDGWKIKPINPNLPQIQENQTEESSKMDIFSVLKEEDSQPKYNTVRKNTDLFSLLVNCICILGFFAFGTLNYFLVNESDDLLVIVSGMFMSNIFMSVFAPLIFCQMNPQILPFVYKEFLQ